MLGRKVMHLRIPTFEQKVRITFQVQMLDQVPALLPIPLQNKHGLFYVFIS